MFHHLHNSVQNELDETKQIVSETLEKILDRGQKLDDLVSRSNELSEQSKVNSAVADSFTKINTIGLLQNGKEDKLMVLYDIINLTVF